MDKPKRYYYKGNPLKQFRAFCSVARNGKMVDAADELFLSQSAISLQIRALEEELDTVLFERNGPRIQITPQGSRLLEMVRPLVEGMDSVADRFKSEVRGSLDSGKIVIAAGESTIIYLLPELVSRFHEAYPNVHVQLLNVTGKDGLAMIRSGKVDFAVGSMLDVPTDISYQPLYTFDPALILPLEHPLAEKQDVELKDISPYGLILPPRRLTTWRMVDRVFQQQRVPYEVVLEVGGWEVIKRYVELGFGISIVTSICLREGDALVARNMSRYFPKRSYGFVKRRGRHLSLPARAFLEQVQDERITQPAWQTGHSTR